MEAPQKTIVGLFQSNTVKMIMVGFLTLVLLIPLALVQDLIDERSKRQDEVVNEISSKWGENVYFYGPVLKVPYKTYEESVSVVGKQAVTQRKATVSYAYFFPEKLAASTDVKTKVRSRNNYESVLYTAAMKFTGNYNRPDFSSKSIPDADIMWNKATLVINTTNLKSIKNQVAINLNGKSYSFEPVFDARRHAIQSLETGYIPASAFTDKTSFSFDITYDGSRDIRIVPVGKTTSVKMTSNWHSPKFSGNYLPTDDRTVTDNGFTADWNVLHINRPFSQQYFGTMPDLSEFAFGVDFIIPVNQYLQNERAAKYGFLVIGLTFLIFFLIQTISKIRIHIFQYTMIGLALVMFYTLLISITEHSSFSFAYIIASLSVVTMISLYSISILKNRKFPAFIAGSLAAMYGFIYVIIQMEQYALLFGSIGLFAILGAVMYVSRKIDWN